MASGRLSLQWRVLLPSNKIRPPMIEQPDLHVAFANDSHRSAALLRLLELQATIEGWLEVAAIPGELPPEVRVFVARDMQVGDTPELKLQRWASVFDDELRAVLDT